MFQGALIPNWCDDFLYLSYFQIQANTKMSTLPTLCIMGKLECLGSIGERKDLFLLALLRVSLLITLGGP